MFCQRLLNSAKTREKSTKTSQNTPINLADYMVGFQTIVMSIVLCLNIRTSTPIFLPMLIDNFLHVTSIGRSIGQKSVCLRNSFWAHLTENSLPPNFSWPMEFFALFSLFDRKQFWLNYLADGSFGRYPFRLFNFWPKKYFTLRSVTVPVTLEKVQGPCRLYNFGRYNTNTREYLEKEYFVVNL